MSGFNHTTDQVNTMGGERLLLEAVISCNGSAPTLQDTNIPGGLTVTHPATGTYQLNFPAGMIPANAGTCKVGCDLGNNASINSNVVYDKSTLLSAGVLKIYTLTAGSAADLASPAEISVDFLFKNTSVPRP